MTAALPLGRVLSAGADWLSARKIPEARMACELLAARLLRVPRLRLALMTDCPLPPPLLRAMRRGLRRLSEGEPVQYVLGEWEFRGHKLKVDRRALIPRPETEQLVQRVLDATRLWDIAEPRICDVGTGSGCIVLSLALERPNGRYTATDRDAVALELARENAEFLKVADRIEFAQGENFALAPPGSFDAVVSNPPYIATGVWRTLSRGIRDYEPSGALDGGDDGLETLRHLIHDAAMVLKPGGGCWLEIGYDQKASVTGIMEQAGFVDVAVTPDLSGRDRFAVGRMP